VISVFSVATWLGVFVAVAYPPSLINFRSLKK